MSVLSACASQTESPNTPSQTSSSVVAPAAPNEAAAIATIKAITQAQADYFQRNRRYALDFEELIMARFLTEEPAAQKIGYVIRMQPSADAARYTVSAVPAVISPSAHHLFADQTGEIHAELGKDATVDSPKI